MSACGVAAAVTLGVLTSQTAREPATASASEGTERERVPVTSALSPLPPEAMEPEPKPAPPARPPMRQGKIEIYIGGGTSVYATRNLREFVGDRDMQFQIGLGGYFNRFHGLFLDLHGDTWGNRGVLRAAPGAELAGGGRVSGFGVSPTYALRLQPAGWIAVTYFASIGPEFFQVRDGTTTERVCTRRGGCYYTGKVVASETVVSIRQRLRVTAPFLKLARGPRWSLAASAVHGMIPGGALGEAPLSGHTFGWLAELVMDTD